MKIVLIEVKEVSQFDADMLRALCLTHFPIPTVFSDLEGLVAPVDFAMADCRMRLG